MKEPLSDPCYPFTQDSQDEKKESIVGNLPKEKNQSQ